MNITIIYAIKESYTDYFDPRFPKWLFLILIVIGISGNLLSLIVFLSSSMKNNSIFTYLAALSIVDLFVIIFGLGDLILISYFRVILRNHSIVSCRLHTFVTYFFSHLSSFILASVSIDRAISLNLANLSRIFCIPKTAHKIIFINAIIVFLVNFHTLILLGSYDQIHYNNSTELTNTSQTHRVSYFRFSCSSKNGSIYDRFLEPYFEWIDLFCYAIIPFTIMVICTFFIVKVLFVADKSYNKTKRLSNVSLDPSLMTNGPLTMANINGNKKCMATKTKNSNRKKNISYMLILLNFLFFTLVSPLLFVLVFLSGIENVREFKILINFVYILAYSNHCLNFVFYGISSPPYRKVVKVLFNKLLEWIFKILRFHIIRFFF